MIALDSRSQNVLMLLLTAGGKPVSTQDLARRLGVTPRMVRYALDRVDQWLCLQGFALRRHPGIGIDVAASPQAQKELLCKVRVLDASGVAFTKTDRLPLLLVTLLSMTRPITAKELQLKLGISRSTVLKDLERADQWLANFHLRLHRRQNVGCEVQGVESKIRKAFGYAVLEGIEDAELLELLYSHVDVHNLPVTKMTVCARALITFLADLELQGCNQLITKLCDESELKLLDHSHAALVLDLGFQISRVRQHRPVEEECAAALNQADLKHTAMVNALAARIVSSRAATLSDSELGYLVMRLREARERGVGRVPESKRSFGADERNQLQDEIPSDVLHVVQEFVSAISVFLHPALQMDTELIRSLANHLDHIRHNEAPRDQVPNPFSKAVIQQYGYVSQLVTKHAYLLKPVLREELIESEIGYMTMYIAASMEMLFIPSNRKKAIIVGDIPRATASLLASRLRYEFQNLEISGLVSYLEYHDSPFQYEHDLVITTSPIDTVSAPVLRVNPLLPPDDVARLANYMRADRDLAYPSSAHPSAAHQARHNRLKHLIDAKTVQCRAEAASWEDVVNIATQPLRNSHKIEHRYVISIKEMIRKSGPYMVIWPGVVLLHALPEDGVRELCMSLTTLRDPVRFGHEWHDPVEIAIVLGTIDKTSHLPALFDLNELIQNISARNEISSTYNKSRLISVVSGFQYSQGHG